VKLTTHLQLVPRLRRSEATPQVLHTLHGVTVFQVLLSSNIVSQTGTPYGLVASYTATYISEQHVVFIFTAQK